MPLLKLFAESIIPSKNTQIYLVVLRLKLNLILFSSSNYFFHSNLASDYSTSENQIYLERADFYNLGKINLFSEDNYKMEFHKIILYCEQCSGCFIGLRIFLPSINKHLCSCSFMTPITGTEVTMVNNIWYLPSKNSSSQGKPHKQLKYHDIFPQNYLGGASNSNSFLSQLLSLKAKITVKNN